MSCLVVVTLLIVFARVSRAAPFSEVVQTPSETDRSAGLAAASDLEDVSGGASKDGTGSDDAEDDAEGGDSEDSTEDALANTEAGSDGAELPAFSESSGGEAGVVVDSWVPILERPKIPPPQRDMGPKQPCSRARSREARQIVEERLIAKAQTYGVQVDPKCKLHPHTDMLREHEANKSTLASTQWKCKICGKIFRSEGYLDLHMDRKHMDTVPAEANICLADFCDILGCRSLEPMAGTACSPKHMQRRRVLCQHLMHNCFPPEINEQYWHAHELFEHELCDRLTCDPSGIGAAMRHSGAHMLRIVFSVVVGIVLIVVAIGVWCHQMDARTGPDLRRRSNRPKAKRGGLTAWLNRLGFARRLHVD